MAKKPLKVIAGAPDQPLVIRGIEIQCYVLEGEVRVLSQRGLFQGLGASRGSGGAEMPRIMASKAIYPYISNELAAALKSPVEFQPVRGGRTAYGYLAEILEDIIDAILDADRDGALPDRYTKIVKRAETLNRGLRRLGIVGLIDEATGYQRIRSERALAEILEKFISAELQPWKKTYPYGFYLEICHLRQWPMEYAVKRPKIVGSWTDDMVYARIAPGVLEELRQLNPMQPNGERKWRYHQWFKPDPGYIKLNQHIEGVRALMRAAPNWGAFQRSLKRAYPKLRDQYEMDLGDN